MSAALASAAASCSLALFSPSPLLMYARSLARSRVSSLGPPRAPRELLPPRLFSFRFYFNISLFLSSDPLLSPSGLFYLVHSLSFSLNRLPHVAPRDSKPPFRSPPSRRARRSPPATITTTLSCCCPVSLFFRNLSQ